MPAPPAYRVAWAFLFSVLVVALAAALISRTLAAFVVIGALAFVFGGVIGVPIYILLRWRECVSFAALVLGGVVAGALPYAAILYPDYEVYANSSAWFNGVAYRVNGALTEAAWSSYFDGLQMSVSLGALGGASFWLMLRGRAKSAA
jgi:hypothetical protein